MSSKTSLSMTAVERRASIALASLFALRMLGLFMLLPVFAVAARGLPGGDDPSRVGLALGMYGLTQAFMQIPFGMASDRWGRRPVVVAGLMLFIAGSVVCALSTDLFWITVGRAIQGSGAISAAVTAWLADSTRDSVRTRAMAMVGASIGMTFAVSLVIAPLLIGVGGLAGLFWTIGCLGLAALAVALWVVPTAPPVPKPLLKVPVRRVITHPDLLRLNLGVFTLHLIQIAMFVVVPAAFIQTGGLSTAELWKVYLPIVLASFVVMVPLIVIAERRGAHRGILRGAVAALVVVCAALTWAQHQFVPLVIAMVAFFSVFNVLEAMQPSLVSRVAPPAYKGLALGFYNTSQAVGLFAGGGLGGWLAAKVGPSAVFEVAAAMALLWLVLAWRMTPPAIRDAATEPGETIRSVP